MIRSLRSYFGATEPGASNRSERNDSPQINIGGYANVHLGDHFGPSAQSGENGHTTDKAKRSLKDGTAVLRDRLGIAMVLLHFTMHWRIMLSVQPSGSDVEQTTASDDFGSDVRDLFRSRLLKDWHKTTRRELPSDPLLSNMARCCMKYIEDFEIALDDRPTLDSSAAAPCSALDIQELQIKTVAVIFLLLCFSVDQGEEYATYHEESLTSQTGPSVAHERKRSTIFKHNRLRSQRSANEVLEDLSDADLASGNSLWTSRLSSASDRMVVEKIGRVRLDHPKILSEVAALTGTRRNEQYSSEAATTAIDQWISKHERVFFGCSKDIAAELRRQHEARIRSHILASLGYTEMDHRYRAINQAQAETFGWVLEHDTTQTGSDIGFARWLAQPQPSSSLNHVFWIRGKPGSGKSTLMRYINDHHRTKTVAATWSASRTLLVVKCFFWSSGTSMQRSQRGLLQTLLYQLLRSRPDFPRVLCPTHWDKVAYPLVASYASDDSLPVLTMSMADIQTSISLFAVHYRESTKLLFLIDGLDEFQGEDDDRANICKLLTTLAQADNVKVCAASRPWNIYLDFFENSPQLKLELLTRGDVERYATHTLHSNAQFDRWRRIEPEAAKQVIDDVVEKAEGVFLWVVLVTRSLVEGVNHGDDVRELAKRLERIPSDLSELFEQMLSKLSPDYLESASQMFEIALHKTHLVLLHHFTHVGDKSDQVVASLRAGGLKRALDLQELEERRINARCMGLLEFCPSSEGVNGYESKLHTVNFLHRTARDYMADQQQRLASWRTSHWDTEAEMYKSTLLAVLSCNPDQLWLAREVLLAYCKATFQQLDHISVSEECTKMISTNQQHLEDIVQFLNTFGITNSGFSDLLTFAILEGAEGYALQRVQQPQFNSHDSHDSRQRPLLYYAVHPNYRRNRDPSIELTAALLGGGASPNTIWRGTSIWREIVLYIDTLPILSTKDPKTISMWADVLKLLMRAGASDFPKEHDSLERLVKSSRMIQLQFPTKVRNDLMEVGKRFRVFENPRSLSNKLMAHLKRTAPTGSSWDLV